jgi:hypothetical protein
MKKIAVVTGFDNSVISRETILLLIKKIIMFSQHMKQTKLIEKHLFLKTTFLIQFLLHKLIIYLMKVSKTLLINYVIKEFMQ